MILAWDSRDRKAIKTLGGRQLLGKEQQQGEGAWEASQQLSRTWRGPKERWGQSVQQSLFCLRRGR